MSYRHGRKWVVVLLAPGESQRPVKLHCVFKFCRRTMMTVNRDVELVIEDSKGIHWADVPSDVTVVEHKCRGCDYYYKIYTPANSRANDKIQTMLDGENAV